MKILCCILSLLVLVNSSAYAIAPISAETIRQAQDYGVQQAQETLPEFLQPWISYEEKAAQLNETTERAYLYTTYLLLATDAREKRSNGKPILTSDSERIITDYSGMLSFSVILFSKEPTFIHNTIAVLKQGKKTIKAYQMTIPSEAESVTGLAGRVFKAQSYFYFSDNDLDLSTPIILVVTTNDKSDHKFYFDLAKIR